MHVTRKPIGFLSLLLVAALVGAPSAWARERLRRSGAPATAEARSERGAAQGERSSARDAAARIDELLTGTDRESKPLLEHPWMRLALRYFGEAQLAAASLARNEAPDPREVDRLHNNLDELLRGLEDMRQGERPNTKQQGAELKGIERPSVKAIGLLEDQIREVKQLANATAGLEEIALVELPSDAGPADAARYGLRVLDKVELVLYARGFGQITGDGRRKTDETMQPCLRELREALSALLRDEPAPEETHGGKAPASGAEKLERLKQALASAQKTTSGFGNAFPPARARLKLVGEDLERMRAQIFKLRPASRRG